MSRKRIKPYGKRKMFKRKAQHGAAFTFGHSRNVVDVKAYTSSMESLNALGIMMRGLFAGRRKVTP